MTTGSQLEEVQVVDTDGIDSRNIPEGFGQTLKSVNIFCENLQGRQFIESIRKLSFQKGFVIKDMS